MRGDSLVRTRFLKSHKVLGLVALLIFFLVCAQVARSAPPKPTTQKLAVTNFVDKPEVNLGAQHKDRKAQCAILDFELTGFDIGNLDQKKIVINKLQSLGIETADDLEAFKKIDPKGWSKTIIYAKTQNGKCPTGTEPYRISQVTQPQTNQTISPSSSVTPSSSSGQCTHDDKTISVALNNYPGNVSDHAAYYKKFNEMNWRCSIKKIPVSKPDGSISANLNDIKTYLAKNAPGLKVVADKTEFDKLSGDDMKKAVILSSTKCKCDGPNSIDYSNSFGDGTKIETRPDTSYKGGLQIGADMNPNNPSVQGPSANGSANGQGTQSGTAPATSSGTGASSAPPASPAGTVGGDLGHSASPSDSDPPDQSKACVVRSDVLVCFGDKRTQDLYQQGKLTNLVNLAGDEIAANTNRTSDKTGKPDIFMLSTPSTLVSKAGGYNPGQTCDIYGSCKDLAIRAVGQDGYNKILQSTGSKNAPALMILMPYTFYNATPTGGGHYSFDMSQPWPAGTFKAVVDHEWSHDFDMTSGERAACTGASAAGAGALSSGSQGSDELLGYVDNIQGLSGSHCPSGQCDANIAQENLPGGGANTIEGMSFISCNSKYNFLSVYTDAIKGVASGSSSGYPSCIGGMLGQADSGEHINDPSGPTELFASTFQAYNNQQNISTLKRLMGSIGGTCQSKTQSLLSDFDKLLKSAQ